MRAMKSILCLALSVAVPFAFIVQCGGGTTGDDAGTDAAPIDAAKDTGKDATTDAGKDATADASDGAIDGPVDSPIDAPKDVTPNDGGTISAISGLVLWLDAAKGLTTNNGSITAWNDQSSQANNAAGGTVMPTLAATSINSLPAAHFVTGSKQYVTIADATSLQFGTGDYFIAVVAKFDNDPTTGPGTGLGSLYTKLGPSSGLLFFANALGIQQQSVSAGLCDLEGPSAEVQYAATYNNGTARLYAVQRASGTLTLRVNASLVATGSSSIDVSECAMPVTIGALTTQPAAALDGDIAEMIVVKGTLSSSDLSNIESYLQSKYNL
jgi:hypothetical protein